VRDGAIADELAAAEKSTHHAMADGTTDQHP
jgi:hypothetical protein